MNSFCAGFPLSIHSLFLICSLLISEASSPKFLCDHLRNFWTHLNLLNFSPIHPHPPPLLKLNPHPFTLTDSPSPSPIHPHPHPPPSLKLNPHPFTLTDSPSPSPILTDSPSSILKVFGFGFRFCKNEAPSVLGDSAPSVLVLTVRWVLINVEFLCLCFFSLSARKRGIQLVFVFGF